MDSFDYIYNHMMGRCIDYDANYPNEFAKGSPCDMLAEEIFAAACGSPASSTKTKAVKAKMLW